MQYFSNMYAERQKALNGGKLSIMQKRVLEIYIPTFSVCALLGVTGYILSDAVTVIQHGESDDVNVYFLFGFAGANFLVDIVSSLMFYWKGKEVLISSPISMERQSIDLGKNKIAAADGTRRSYIPNLNMISALTHVGSDTLRTTSVFVAAIISEVGHFNAGTCDAWAAVVITITICFAVVPLLTEIFHAIDRINAEAKEEASTDLTERPSIF